MDISKLKKRNPSMDILRIVAVLSVLCVHFFLHNGFYSQVVQGPEMYIATVMRTLFSICVPLFIILTGYLMSQKTISKKYYKGITKTLIIFVIATLACMIYKTAIKGEDFSLIKFLFNTLDFTGANYSWYIEMYIGLFLIAPFLNLAYNKLDTQRKKQVLVFTFVAISILPTLFNIYNFSDISWWADPKSNDTFQKIFPGWWTNIYPLAYYFTGCYIREYGMKIKTRTAVLVFFSALILFASFNYYRCFGTFFKTGVYVFWNGFEPYVLSTLLFVMISRIKTDKMHNGTRYILWKISDLAFGIYLISYIFDETVYGVLGKNVVSFSGKLPFFVITVPIIFILSAISSGIMNLIADGIIMLYHKIKEYVIQQKEKNKQKLWQDILFIVLFAGGFAFAFWKCRYGFGGNDEAFYLTIPHRLSMGDSLFTDEWHLSQLSGFLLLPFVSLYTTIFGNTTGIIFAARIAYIIFHSVICLVIYSRIKKYGIISVFATILFYIFTPYNIMALSYNTMGLDLVAVTGVIMGTISYKKVLPVIIAGITFAGAVLCSPYLAAAYVLYGICVIVHYIIKNRTTSFVISSKLFSIKTFALFTIGAGVLAVIFLIFVLSRIGINDIINSLPNLMTDPEHPQIPLGRKVSLYFNSIYSWHKSFMYAVFIFVGMLIVIFADKKRKLHRSVYLLVSAGLTIFSLGMTIAGITSNTYNTIMFPMMFTGITSYILCDKKPKNLFVSLFVLGIIYSVSLSFTSNQYFYVISMAWSASNIASFVFTAQLLKEMRKNDDNLDYAVLLKYSAFVSIALIIALQGTLQIKSKAEHCFWEGKIETMTETIPDGPAKGIKTDSGKCNEYIGIYNDVDEFCKNHEKDNILFLTDKTWCYLAANNYPYGTLSAWISGENVSTIERLKTYYSVNPAKIPKYVYVPKVSDWDKSVIDNFAKLYDYKMNENLVSYQLVK